MRMYVLWGVPEPWTAQKLTYACSILGLLQ